MIVLDTNVISELMRPEPHPAVLTWVASQPRASLYTTSINRAEILYGVAAMPPGRRRAGFELVATAIFAEDFAGRVLAFDGKAAGHYARIVVERRQAGAPIEGFDALIAAAAVAAGFAIATRDIGGFERCGAELINPWQSLIRKRPRSSIGAKLKNYAPSDRSCSAPCKTPSLRN